ncbi:CheR family methyltransferase [Xanthomonas sp. XNM01]|uniref:CheR family methyltransferase n=1 Tax=Xanthomonas sp. XNM01 TaxID=2769289 RepID=UPI0017827B72|nr:CheR family methyltransferase [Xanthomonas sp. XNM01]MBD9369020.1 SAM-dependent methyltransferase [Xanthomonas sp. XNM01]
MSDAPITALEFSRFQRFISERAGITLADSKKAMLCGRLGKRLRANQMTSYSQYLRLLEEDVDTPEVQIAIDLLTTNETYFFREPKHFDLLARLARQAHGSAPFRCWSAASSSGEEAFSMAMVLEDALGGRPYEVVGSDISSRVLERARSGLYPMQRLDHMPPGYLKRFCRKGNGRYEGYMLIERGLREHVRFLQLNLNAPLPGTALGMFDVVFLRNVMIYFDGPTKYALVKRLLSQLRPGGHLCVGHSESLNEFDLDLVQIAPAVYRRP